MICPIKYCPWELDIDEREHRDVIDRHFLYHHTTRQMIDTLLQQAEELAKVKN